MNEDKPYRLELWRVDPPRLFTWFMVPPGGSICYMPPPWNLPVGWPTGYEWRRVDMDGTVADRCPCDVATPWVSYEDPNADLDWLPGRLLP